MSARRSSLLVLTAALSVSWTAGAAPGQSTSADGVNARELSDTGLARFRQGDYDGALDAFSRSYEMAHEPALLFDIAQAHRKKGDCQAALDFYRRFLGAVDAQTAARTKAEAYVEQMQACLASPTSPAPTPSDTPRSAPPPSPVSRDPIESAPPAKLPSGDLKRPALPPEFQKSSGRPFKIAGLTAGAVGLAALVAGVVITLRMGRIEDRVSAAFDAGGPSTSMVNQLVSDGRADETAARILYAGGLAALVTGGALYYWGATRRTGGRTLNAMAGGSKHHAALSLAISF